ncbi:endopeptidase [Pseudozyma hubeiensis SY62]|uniref:Endopeptidase n=1 Tax=Pseudozyma hubeiensis (strain SY62) TaxID=1305764 RepID=R9NZZ9_PSEHS|nr:endopeptidase [Pseudozyma hubeiensis SY62]GAC94374.1 endopeptidase [Pseudozyma hubeiensis SY62]
MLRRELGRNETTFSCSPFRFLALRSAMWSRDLLLASRLSAVLPMMLTRSLQDTECTSQQTSHWRSMSSHVGIESKNLSSTRYRRNGDSEQIPCDGPSTVFGGPESSLFALRHLRCEPWKEE